MRRDGHIYRQSGLGGRGLVKDCLNPFDTMNKSECQLNNCLY
jgi:hypothetical protein